MATMKSVNGYEAFVDRIRHAGHRLNHSDG